MHTSVDHILSDLPAARAAWFHIVVYHPSGERQCALTWPRAEQAWRSYVRACAQSPGQRVELQRRGHVIRARAAGDSAI